eukprot:gene40439-50019_t
MSDTQQRIDTLVKSSDILLFWWPVADSEIIPPSRVH